MAWKIGAIMFSMENLDMDHRPYGVDTFDLMEAALYAETTCSSGSSCNESYATGFMDDCSDQVRQNDTKIVILNFI
jgi:hypothetical protein